MKYVAFLRGVNVGGKNIIKMADLKQMFAILGINEVSTYIQSGNVIFSSDDNETFLVDKIEVGILQTFGFSASVILRTLDELREIVDNNPYLNGESKDRVPEIDNFYIFLFSQILSSYDMEYISLYKGADNYSIVGRNMYVLFDTSIHNSKIVNALNRIDVTVTSRNMKTVMKILEINNK